MGMQINTNIAALNSYRNLSNTQNDMSKSLEKLSSGLRINRAADDAAGLAISEGLRSQINGLNVASRNAQDGISVIQTAEGTLTEVHSILQRVRDLAVQAGNDSNSDEARAAIGNEAKGLVEELDRISKSTNFNGIQLLDGSVPTLNFQIGANGDASSQISVDLAQADITAVVDALAFGSTAVKGVGVNAANTTLALGADAMEFAQGSTVVEVDLSGATLTKAEDLVKALNDDKGFAQNFVATLNKGANDAVTTDDYIEITSRTTDAGAITVRDDHTTPGTLATTAGTTPSSVTIGFDSAAAAQASITAIDTQIQSISTARANLGAIQNRFESTINSLNVSAENLSAAESRIRDTDMAQEMVNFTRAQILSQAGTAMLAQANTSNQGVLQLLRG